MNLTIKAVLARFGGDRQQAFAYCVRMQARAANPEIRIEYHIIAQTIWNLEAAHA
jgi:hypothetical protein